MLFVFIVPSLREALARNGEGFSLSIGTKLD